MHGGHLLGEDVDIAFEVLADPHRRLALDLLHRLAPETVEEQTLAALIEEVASVSDGELARVGDVTTGLYHAHLPKLDEAGFVDWDRTRGTIAYSGDEFIERCLDVVRTHRGSDPVERVLSRAASND